MHGTDMPQLIDREAVLLRAWGPSGTDTSDPRILPHTQEAGDPYYIGDIYQGTHITRSGELKNLNHPSDENLSLTQQQKPYQKYLESLSKGWPHISYLADFMKVTTSPPKLKFLQEKHKLERASRTKVTTLNFEPGAPVTRVDYSNICDLSAGLKSRHGHDNVHVRLFVVEDLSRDVIEELGARFDVDPLFFRGHISDYTWNNTRDPWAELPDLDITARNRSYAHVRYVQTRYFRSEEHLRNARLEVGNFNVLRRVDKDGSWVEGADIPGSDIGLVRSRISLWIRPNKEHESGILGILLVDPTITEGFPIWGGYRNLQDCPSMLADPVASGPPRTSTFDDIIYWTSSLTTDEISDIAKDPRVLFKKTLLVVCAEWYTLIKYATTRLIQLEWELENPQLQDDVGGLEVTIEKLHSWRRRFSLFRTLTSEVLEKIVKREHFSSYTGNRLGDLRRDYEIIVSDIEKLHVRADRIMAVVTATMSIEESKKAFEQNRSLARLTWLAVTFVPLSFITSMFSMQSDLSSLKQSFWIFFSVGIPVTALVLLVTKYSTALSRAASWKRANGFFSCCLGPKKRKAYKWR